MPEKPRSAERRERFETDSGIEVRRVYGPEPPDPEVGLPGEYPFVRGIYPNMYRGRLWTMRQYAGFGTAEETNRRYKYLVEQGQTGLSVAFDLPTQLGLDSDSPLAVGEVGKAGVSISTLQDMETLFDGIPLERISTSMTINSPASVLLAMYVAVAEGQGVAPGQLSGTIQNDILKEYAARNTYIFPPDFSMRLATDTIMYCSRSLPRWNSISISGYHIREAGSDAVQELAFTLADGIAYVEAVRDRGMAVDDFAPRLSFFFSSDSHFFEEVAKYRAARRLWAKIMKERFGAQKKESMMLRFHTQTAGSSLTARQPLNNVVRVTLQALAAVLGGTQSLHTNSYDEALSLPTEDAVRIALRTQQIIAEESGAADTADPLGSSRYVEELTDELERRASEYIARIDGLGGMIRAIARGFVQREIERSAYRKQREIETQKRTVVGVNKYCIEEGERIKLLTVDQNAVEAQLARLKAFREGRDARRHGEALSALDAVAAGDGNLLPPILEAVRARATVGEICDVFRRRFGEHREPSTLWE
ncbi:MAG: methylmalonyl-CoA mutase [Euryarchaeota archaeon]|nr:methylmalonyl-CoA mutase [Euryarchaeota archaeon]